MDPSALRLPNPSPTPVHGERRSCVRQKLHSPVYVSFNGPRSGLVIDLSELVDLHEGGFSVRTAEPLEVDRALTLCLDLPETKSFIHGSGQVVWSDDSGRAGIRFSFLPDPSKKVLREWLFANLLVASTNYAARSQQRAQQEQKAETEAIAVETVVNDSAAFASPILEPAPLPEAETPIHAEAGLSQERSEQRSPAALIHLDHNALEIAFEELRHKIHDTGIEADVAFDLISSTALSLTGASGTALALILDDEMVCRSRAGSPAPPLGAVVNAKEGLSGECVRTGRPVRCDNTETDSRVDPELCRALGIASLMAVPIFGDFRVLGLLEVFSPYPGTFSSSHQTILDRLAELVPKDVPRAMSVEAENPTAAHSQPASLEPAAEPVIEPHLAQAENDTMQLPDSEEKESIVSAEVANERNQGPNMAATPDPVLQEQAAVPKRSSDSIQGDRPAEVAQPSLKISAAPTATAPEFQLLAPSPRKTRVPNIVLLFAVLGLAALLGGFLLAPVIERRLNPPASEQSASDASQLEAASLKTILPNHPQPLSLPELRHLADQGDPGAQWRLGALYHDGDGVPQDDTQAVQWFLRSADQGYVLSQATLGAYYWAGRGVPKDYTKAYFWSALALARGDENSRSRLEGLSAQMTRSQVNEARQQAEVWLRAHTSSSKPAGN